MLLIAMASGVAAYLIYHSIPALAPATISRQGREGASACPDVHDAVPVVLQNCSETNAPA